MASPKKKAPYNQYSAIRGALRRCFSRSPIVREVLQKVRREVPKYRKDGSRALKDSVQYLCNVCHKYVGSTHISVDHIEPVIPESGFTNWEDFVNRLFCGQENLQTICDSCHDAKSKSENARRRLIKDKGIYKSLSCRPMSSLNVKELKLLLRLKKKLNIVEK